MNNDVFNFLYYFSQFAPQIFRTERDTFQIEFENDDYYFEIEIFKNQPICCLYENKLTKEMESFEFSDFNKCIKFFEKHKGDFE